MGGVKILITGGLGFIGNNIVKLLYKKNAEITILDKIPYNTGIAKKGGIKFIVGDVLTYDMLKIKKGHFDYIFHFGAPCSNMQFIKNPELYPDTIKGMINIMELAKALDSRVIYPSSGTVYSGNYGREDSVLPLPSSLYAAGKISCEYVANYYEKIYGIKSTGLRIFAGYGDGEEKKGALGSAISLFLIPMLKGLSPEVWGNGKQIRDFVYIKDVMNLLEHIMKDENAPRVLNVGSGKSFSFNEIIHIINKHTEKDIVPIYKHKPTGYLDTTLADISLAKNLYNFKPTTIESGIKQYIEYLNNV